MQKIEEKISICPPKVQGIINQANYLPFDFPETYEIFPESAEEAQKRINELAKILPDSFIQSSPFTQMALRWKVRITASKLDEPLEETEIEPLHWIYSAISTSIRCRKALERVVKWNKESSNSPSIKLNNDDIRFFGFKLKNGVIQAHVEFPLVDLINENIDTRRIKQCGNCQNFSWSKRLNKNVENYICESCSNKLRQKRFVSIPKNKEEISKRRRIAYYRNKGIKILCEKCAYPHTKCSCYLKERNKK
jgi:hypothetical protein